MTSFIHDPKGIGLRSFLYPKYKMAIGLEIENNKPIGKFFIRHIVDGVTFHDVFDGYIVLRRLDSGELVIVEVVTQGSDGVFRRSSLDYLFENYGSRDVEIEWIQLIPASETMLRYVTLQAYLRNLYHNGFIVSSDDFKNVINKIVGKDLL